MEDDGDTLKAMAISNIINTIAFSNTNYWANVVNQYSIDVFDENSNLYNLVQNYQEELKAIGYDSIYVTIPSYFEIIEIFGCNNSNCKNAPSWLYSSRYWTRTAYSSSTLWIMDTTGTLDGRAPYNLGNTFGLRPIITISKEDLIEKEETTTSEDIAIEDTT